MARVNAKNRSDAGGDAQVSERAPGDRYSMRLVDKVFDILEAFDPNNRELTLQEIVDRTGQTKSGAYRILANLTRRGMLERDALTRRFRVGTKLYSLGSLASLDVRRLAFPYLESLRDEFGWTANLSVRDGLSTVLVEVLDGARPFQMSATIGTREPLYCTASGKCLLAFAPAADRERLVADIDFVPHTPNTLTTPAALLAELAQVRERSFALDRGEYGPHGRCVAVPLFDRRGRVCAALSLSGPEAILSREQLTPLAERMKTVGACLSTDLGAREYPIREDE
jgi:IclR family transcriptional regulator, KDG regulon repressor